MPDVIVQSDNDPDDYDLAGLTRTPQLEEFDPSVRGEDDALGGALGGHPPAGTAPGAIW
ncbi:MAG: hypothetical protein Q8S00_25540 [Deltaproteobacteria bacterium]|nr:hypothetical protein [Deltaproteobacteria bacterium]